MKASAKAGAALAAALIAPALAVAQVPGDPPPAANDAIVAGARACAAALTATGVDQAKLLAAGWSKAAVSSNGQPVPGAPTIYGRQNVLILLPTKATRPACAVSARLAAATQVAQLSAAFRSAFGPPAQVQGAESVFRMPGNRLVNMAAVGNDERPGVRLIVINTPTPAPAK